VGSAGEAPYATEGTCIYLDGSAQSIPIQINIVASQINACRYGLYYGPYVQGIQITASNFVSNDIAIYQPPNSPGNDELAIGASQFNSGTSNILLGSPIDGVAINGNVFYLSEHGSASIQMPGVQFAILGNTFNQLGTPRATAIAIGAYMLDAGTIMGNSFKNFDTAIALRSGSGQVTVQGNAYSAIRGAKVRNDGNGNHIASDAE
jgi:hypothetical protein